MKNIFLSVDFSKNGKKIALFTAEMAQHSAARLILYHAYYPIAVPDDELEADIYNEKLVQSRLDKLARKLHKETGVSITRLLKPASTKSEALEVAKIVKADIAVLCDEAITDTTAATNASFENLAVLTVSTNSNFNSKVFRNSLLLQLQDIGYTPTPQLEPI